MHFGGADIRFWGGSGAPHPKRSDSTVGGHSRVVFGATGPRPAPAWTQHPSPKARTSTPIRVDPLAAANISGPRGERRGGTFSGYVPRGGGNTAAPTCRTGTRRKENRGDGP